MTEVYCYAFAEDELSCAVMVRLIEFVNETTRKLPIRFFQGFPQNKHGKSNLKSIIHKVCNMSKSNICSIVLTDLDRDICAPEIIRSWFCCSNLEAAIPENVIFRVAESEVESWLLADRHGLSRFLEISKENITKEPDALIDPKEYLLGVIRKKGNKKYHRQMLPMDFAHVGPEYNPILSKFAIEHWNIKQAQQKSPSLQRTVFAISKFKNTI